MFKRPGESRKGYAKRWYEANKPRYKFYQSTKRTQAQQRNKNLKAQHGITSEQYMVMAWAQDFRCTICDRHESDYPGKGLVIEHNHETGIIRGLTCILCNTKLGWLERNYAKIHEHLARGELATV